MTEEFKVTITEKMQNDFRENIKDATIYTEILGSDHCPVGLEIK